MDLSDVDWDAVKTMFASGRQRTAVQKLRSMLTARITNLTLLNPTRVDLYDRFQRLLDQYNAGSLNVQQYFDELVKLSHSLTEEEARAVSTGLTATTTPRAWHSSTSPRSRRPGYLASACDVRVRWARPIS